MANTITADDIREHFSQAMSAMYQQEVPQYGTLTWRFWKITHFYMNNWQTQTNWRA